MIGDFIGDLNEFMRKMQELNNKIEKKTTTISPSKRTKPHNHFPQGKTGYIPRGVGVTDLRILKRK